MLTNTKYWENTYKVILKELQPFLTLSYLIAIGIGMIFTYHKYSTFGINIFEYADVFDFLIAPFSDLKILIYTVLSLTITYLILKFDLIAERKYPTVYSKSVFGLNKKNWYNYVRYPSFGLIFLLYLSISADTYGKISKKQILEQHPIEVIFSDSQRQTGKVIGKTKEVLFLAEGNSVNAIPIAAFVKMIEVKR